ncbi:hypothetical protein EMCG_06764 [[Emmonsia] crescens]|uniref:Uncharacterized protein n=1 Tax=[Emmonsia] crescens TaxID=73230 RepID=A0A0G2IB84_9EURO|nr:hypothetical protein EMCG_06764 [Emmonsia crescens UAMH 3008]
MDTNDQHFSFHRAGNYSYPDLPQIHNEVIMQGNQTVVVPSMHARSMNSYHARGGVKPAESQSYGSKFPIHPQNNSNCNPPLGSGEARGRHWESSSNPALAAPDLWTGGTSRETRSSGSRTSEMAQGIYDSDAVPPILYQAGNPDDIISGPLDFDRELLSLVGEGGVNCSNLNQGIEALIKSCYPLEWRSGPWPQQILDESGVSAGRRDNYDRPEPYTLVGYDSQLVSGLVEQQGSRIPNDARSGLDVFGISPELVDERTPQPTATPIDRIGEKREMLKQKSCWQCRFKHEKVFDSYHQEDLIRSRRLETVNGKSTVVSESVLPIRPVGQSKNLFYYIGSWIDKTARSPDLLPSWVTVSVMNKIHSSTSGDVLRAICRYYTECGITFAPSEPYMNKEQLKDANDTLQHAMKGAILATVLSTCIRITPGGLQSLPPVFQTDPAELSRKWMIPRLMNKMFKYVVFRNSIYLTNRALIGLDKLLNQKDISEGHLASIVTLLATSISATQLSLVDVCRTTQGGENAVQYEQVKREISEMESAFSRLSCLLHRRCKIETLRSERRYSELDDKTKDLVDRLSDIIPALRENTSHIRDLKFENMEHIHALELGVRIREDVALFNADRLFCALLAPMLTDNTRKRRRRRGS